MAVDEQLKTRADARPHNEAVAGFWKKYQNFNSHANFVAKLAEQNPEIVQKVQFGSSHEKRPLVAALIGEKPNSSKKAIWIEGGIHAREWISPATVTYFAQQLVNLYNEKDPTVQDLLKYYDFYIVPVLNADGYEYSHTNVCLENKQNSQLLNNYQLKYRIDYGERLDDHRLQNQLVSVPILTETLVINGAERALALIHVQKPTEEILRFPNQKLVPNPITF